MFAAYAISAVVLAGNPCAGGALSTIDVSAVSATNYTINGELDPPLTLVRGCTYNFNIDASGHPFMVKTVQGSGPNNAYSGFSPQSQTSGTVVWTVAADAPSTLFYNCQIHAAMTNSITIIDGPLIFDDGFE